jgi:hypothetical protein
MSDESTREDPTLALLLSRLAALQGQAVPAHRFGMLDKTDDGVELAALGRLERARESWLARFPQAEWREVTAERATRSDMPALWIWQILDGTSAKMVGDAVYTFAGEGRALPPFVSPADPSPPSPGSGGPSESTP